MSLEYSHRNIYLIIIWFLSVSCRTLVARGALLASPPPLSFSSSKRGAFCATKMSQSTTTTTSASSTFSNFLTAPDETIQPHIVLGNEAGDADSIISALSLAYIDCTFNTPKTPIVSIPRRDLPLRRETVFLLQLAGLVNTDQLHFIDDPNVWDGVEEITLVDHNRLTVDSMEDVQVVEILDHHVDEDFHENVQGEFRKVAFENNHALVASTCTLVAERLFCSPNAKPPYDASLSISLLGVILLDTVNMKPEAGKGTPRDEAAINTLLQHTDWSTLNLKDADAADLINNDKSATRIDTNKLFQLLSGCKFDVDFWNSLSVTDALRLDYKRFQASSSVFGASSILTNLDSFLAKPHLVEEIQSFMKQVNIPLLVVLSSQFQNNTQRELLLCASNENETLVKEMTNYLLTSEKANMMQSEQVPLGISIDDDATQDTLAPVIMKRIRQGNPKASRKQVAPIMLSFYSSS